MASTIGRLLDTEDFPARWNCGVGSKLHGWPHIVADLSIAAAYFVLPILIGTVTLRRRDTPFLPIFCFFVAIILTCVIGRPRRGDDLLDAVPWYRLSALCEVVTALASWATIEIGALPIVIGDRHVGSSSSGVCSRMRSSTGVRSSHE